MTKKLPTQLEIEYNRYFNKHFAKYRPPVMDDKVRKILKYIGENQHILDIGCLTGYIGYFCLKKSPTNTVVGIDFIELALKHAGKNGVDARLCNIETDEIPVRENEKFDVVIMSEVIEHLVDPYIALQKIHGVLKQGGQLIVSTPNIAYILYRWELLIGKLPDFCEFRGRYSERPYNFQHKSLFTRQVLQKTLENIGFSLMTWDYHDSYKSQPEQIFSPLEKLLPTLFVKNMVAVAQKLDN